MPLCNCSPCKRQVRETVEERAESEYEAEPDLLTGMPAGAWLFSKRCAAMCLHEIRLWCGLCRPSTPSWATRRFDFAENRSV